MNALESESELDATTYLKCLLDAIDRGDTISLVAWEALTVLSSFWINSSDGSTSTIILSSKYLHQIRCFFLNMFPIRKLNNSKNDEDGEIGDLSTAKSQSTHLFQLFKVIVQSVYNSKDEINQTKLDAFRSILVPLIKACKRRDALFQNHVPSTKELLSEAMLEFVLDTSSEQRHHRLVVLMEIFVHFNSIKHWNRMKNTIQEMIDDAFQSNHDRDIVIAMTTCLSQVFAYSDTNVCDTNGSISRDAWMFVVLTIYEASCSKTTQLFESIDKVLRQEISSLSQRELNDFVTMLSTIRLQSNDGSTISQWAFINIAFMCQKFYGLDRSNIAVQSGAPTTLLQEFIVDPILQDDDFKFDVDTSMKELFQCCKRHDFAFSLVEGENQYGDVLRFMNKVSNVLRQCICPIKNNPEYTWNHKHIFVDLLRITLNTPAVMKNIQVQFAIISMSVTIFMDFIDFKKNVLSIFLDAVQRYASLKNNISHEFAGHMVVILSRLSPDQEDNDHAWFTSTLIQIAKRSMSHRTVLKFVLKALSFSNHGRLWISDHVVTELDSCSAERRCYGFVGLEALIGLCSYPQFLADIHVIRGLKSACEIIQSHEDDLKLDLSTSQLDPWTKERLLNAALLSLIQYFCGEAHPNNGCHKFAFVPESDGLNKLTSLIESTLILLPQDLRIYVAGNQDISSSEIPYFLSIAVSCLRALMNFLREKKGLSSNRSSDLRNLSFSPGYESISNHENNAWTAKMSEFSTDFKSPFQPSPNIVTQAPAPLNRKRFTPTMHLSLCYTFVREFLMWKTELVECISCIELSHQVNLLLGATESYLDLSQVKYFNLKDSLDLKRICMIWNLVIDSLNGFEVDKVSSCIDRKDYLSNLFPAMQLICSHQTHILQCEMHSTSEVRDLFQNVRHVYMCMFSKTACCGVDFADEDKFVRDFKSIILDQLLIILSQLKGDVGLDSKLDLSFYATFLSDLGQDLKKSCDGQNGGVTKSVLRSYVVLIEGLLIHIENLLNHVELQASAWNVIIKLNIVSLFCVDILFLCPIPKSIFKSLAQIGIYQIPTLVRNTKLALVMKRVRCPETQKSGILDPILVVSTLRKCMERTDSDNNYVWLSTFCAESIGRLWAESSNIKECLEVQIVCSLVEFQDGLLLDYYLEQHSWYQTLLHLLYSCTEESCSVQLSPLVNALTTSSVRIFGALKKNVNHLTRSCWQIHEQLISNANSLAFLDSYLTVSTWILFVNQAKQASPIKLLQDVQNSDQMKKNNALIAKFHAHLRKLFLSLNEYESAPLVEALSIVNTKIYGSDQLNFATELIAYFERNGIKPVKANRRSLSSKGVSTPTRKRSRSVKRSRNQLIDEWLEADHETQDDYEDLEDFLLPG